MGHWEDLESCYFGLHYRVGNNNNNTTGSLVPTKNGNVHGGAELKTEQQESEEEEEEGDNNDNDNGTSLKVKPLGLDLFTKKLSKLVKFGGYEVMATLKFGDVNSGNSLSLSLSHIY